ncbi:MAG: hypothetical protein ACE5GO_06160 [Anaerolineales bacterium]
MLEQEDFEDIHQYMIRVLPRLLRETPEVVYTIEGIIAEHFPRRDEFARLLDEFTSFRWEMLDRFDESDKRFDESDRRFDSFRQETRGRFDEVDKRFDESDKRFDSFRQETRGRFDEVDKRFGEVDKRFDEVDKRFDEVDDRFDKVDDRFDKVDEEMAGLKQTTLHNRREIAKVIHGQERLIRRMDAQEAWLRYVTGTMQTKKGHSMEDMVAKALRYGLKNPDIKPENIRLRQKLRGTKNDGMLSRAEAEIDLILENGRMVIVEVKTYADTGDAVKLDILVRLLRNQNPDKHVEGMLICLSAEEGLRQYCERNGIILVD